MRRFLTILVCAVGCWLSAYGQQRYSCTHNTAKALTRGLLDYPNKNWDPNRIYRQPVILISFKDCDFSMPDPVEFYSRILNEPGYNEGVGMGCLADYFRDQSAGLFNLQFDIYGPIKVDTLVTGNGKTNYGEYSIRKATQELAKSADIDFSPYDWDGDGYVNQVIYIAAGYCGNQVSGGYIWPNSSDIYPSVKMPGDVTANYYSISCELWGDKTSCGIGTICHEFTHCLGLPDIYPTSSGAGFSVVDEWDLMDGGNYTGKGWCPPNYSALEKMLMGWGTPTELTEPTTITDMKCVSDGGETYLIRNPGCEDEFYILENRQQKGWDYGAPGNGLLIIHVDYDREEWSNNQVNVSKGHYRYDLFHADGKDYMVWDPKNNGQDMSKYTVENWLRNSYLSTSPYPYYDEELDITNVLLTDYSFPAATVFHENTDGNKFMSRPVTDIEMNDDGIISFNFMKDPVSVEPICSFSQAVPVAYYDLTGRRLSSPGHKGICIIRYSDGTTRKIMNNYEK